jgi:DNA-binding transcriptional MerR regulator
MEKRFWSGDLKRILNIAYPTIYNWEEKGIIPTGERDKISRRRYWTKEQVEEAIKNSGRGKYAGMDLSQRRV